LSDSLYEIPVSAGALDIINPRAVRHRLDQEVDPAAGGELLNTNVV